MNIFHPDPYKLQLYDSAITETVQMADMPIDPYFIKSWVGRHKVLGEELQLYLPPLVNLFDERYHTFYSLYNYFAELLGYLDISETCEVAFEEYSKIIQEHKQEEWDNHLKGWVARFKHIGLNEALILPLVEGDANMVKTIGSIHYVVETYHFSNLVCFNDVFTMLYWEQEIRP